MSAGSVVSQPGPEVRTTRELWRSLAVWLALMALVVLVKVVVMAFYPEVFRSPSQEAVFAWPSLALWTALGAVGIWCAHAAGLPGAWDERVSNRERLLLPALIGLAFGAVFVAWDLLSGYSRILTSLYNEPAVNIMFPANVLIYPAASIIVEVIYRLVLIPLPLWLISKVILGGRAFEVVFWVLAILSSLFEPVTQHLEALTLAPVLTSIDMALGFSLNLGQALVFRRYGVLASILVRVAFYVVWHMIYVH